MDFGGRNGELYVLAFVAVLLFGIYTLITVCYCLNKCRTSRSRIGSAQPFPEDMEDTPTGATKTGFNQLADVSAYSSNNKETEMGDGVELEK